jgi:hypothetical protein
MPGFPSHPDQCTQLYCVLDAENIVEFLTYNSEYKGVVPCPQQTQIGHTCINGTFQADTKVPIVFRPKVDPALTTAQATIQQQESTISALKSDIKTLHASLTQVINTLNTLTNPPNQKQQAVKK